MNMAADGAKSAYVPAIDGLRAVAVLSVIAFHLRATYLPGGFNGVDVFYVISGFVVTNSLVGRSFPSFPSFLSFFYARRLQRIMPALIVSLLFAFTLSALFIPEAWISSSTRSTGVAAFFGLSNIVLALNKDSYFAPATALNPFTHTWSLGVEEQFYLLFPFIMYWAQAGGQTEGRRRRVIQIVAGLSLVSFLICGVLTSVEHQFAFYLIFSRFWELGVGMLGCLLPGLFGKMPAPARSIVGIASAVLIVSSFILGENLGFPFPLALLPVLGTIGIIYAVVDRPAGLIARALAWKPAVVCGRCSYSLYLWHWPIMVGLRWTVGLDGVWPQVAAIALTFAAGAASYILVEQPFRHNFKAWPRSRVVGLVCALTIVAATGAWIESRVAKHLTLSVTGKHGDWYAEAKPIPVANASGCAVDMNRSQFLGANVTRWTPKGCAAKAPGRLIVLGDSHALAIAPALARLSSELGIEVVDYSKIYCGFLTLQRALAATTECNAYGAGLEQKLLAFLRPGDVVLLESLRMPRFQDQDGTTSANYVSTEAEQVAATKEAEAMLTAFTTHGAKVVFPLPLPVLPTPPFRCSDWFNRSNPVCKGGLSLDKVAVEALRFPVKEQIKTIAAAVPGIAVWDPLPIVCPGSVCAASLNGRPIFFDGDHLSGYGNELIYPELRRIVQSRSKNKQL